MSQSAAASMGGLEPPSIKRPRSGSSFPGASFARPIDEIAEEFGVDTGSTAFQNNSFINDSDFANHLLDRNWSDSSLLAAGAAQFLSEEEASQEMLLREACSRMSDDNHENQYSHAHFSTAPFSAPPWASRSQAPSACSDDPHTAQHHRSSASNSAAQQISQPSQRGGCVASERVSQTSASASLASVMNMQSHQPMHTTPLGAYKSRPKADDVLSESDETEETVVNRAVSSGDALALPIKSDGTATAARPSMSNGEWQMPTQMHNYGLMYPRERLVERMPGGGANINARAAYSENDRAARVVPMPSCGMQLPHSYQYGSTNADSIHGAHPYPFPRPFAPSAAPPQMPPNASAYQPRQHNYDSCSWSDSCSFPTGYRYRDSERMSAIPHSRAIHQEGATPYHRENLFNWPVEVGRPGRDSIHAQPNVDHNIMGEHMASSIVDQRLMMLRQQSSNQPRSAALAQMAHDAALAAAAASAASAVNGRRSSSRTDTGAHAAAAAAAAAASRLIHAEAEASGSARGSVRSSSINRRAWSAEEDQTIRECVAQMGMRWRLIAPLLPGRSDDSVRNRWKRLQEEDAGEAGDEPQDDDESRAGRGDGAKKHKASGESKRHSKVAKTTHAKHERDGEEEQGQRVSWSSYEDQVIVQAVQELGPRWCAVAARLPSRTDQAVRNRWNRLQQRARVQARTMLAPFGERDAPEHGVVSRPRVSTCG